MKATRDNLFTDGARGSARNMTIRKTPGNKFVISAKSQGSHLPPTDEQINVRQNFKMSINYFKMLKQNPEKLAVYTAAAKPGKSAFNLAVKDFNTSPVVKSINAQDYTGKAGEGIMVRAIDDFAVVSVTVSIFNAGGQLLEKGNAILQMNGYDWLYTATLANAQLAGSKITAVAADIPNNTGSLEIVLS